MDQFRAMRVFTRVIDEGSFAQASRALDLAPAVVTRIIAELEEHLGARLINRTTRRLALTDIGESYLERVRRILIEVEEAEALASMAAGDPQGHLRILMPPAFAVHQVVKHLPRFRRAYPKVTLEFATPGPVESVDENYDLSIIMVAHDGLDGDFVARRLARSEIIACATPQYLDERGRPTHPQDLVHHDPIVPTRANASRDLHLVRATRPGAAVERATVRLPVPVLDCTHIDTNYAAALGGLGIAGLPSFVIGDALLENALERVLPEWSLVTLSLYAAMPTRKFVPARTRAFLEFLVESFGGEDRDPWLQAAGCETVPGAPRSDLPA